MQGVWYDDLLNEVAAVHDGLNLYVDGCTVEIMYHPCFEITIVYGDKSMRGFIIPQKHQIEFQDGTLWDKRINEMVDYISIFI